MVFVAHGVYALVYACFHHKIFASPSPSPPYSLRAEVVLSECGRGSDQEMLMVPFLTWETCLLNTKLQVKKPTFPTP